MNGLPNDEPSRAARSSSLAKSEAEVAQRDQSESTFAAILSSLVARVVGAEAAALVDPEGETVDYSGKGAPDEIRIAAAHWGLVLRDLRTQPSLARVSWFLIEAERATFLLQTLPEGYALVLRLVVEPQFVRFERALGVAALAMAREAGWAFDGTLAWTPVEVVLDGRDRPNGVKFGETSQPIELLGRYAEPFDVPGALAERAWRVRLAFGAEATLVREPSGFWYADEPLEELAERGGSVKNAGAAPRHTLFKQSV